MDEEKIKQLKELGDKKAIQDNIKTIDKQIQNGKRNKIYCKTRSN